MNKIYMIAKKIKEKNKEKNAQIFWNKNKEKKGKDPNNIYKRNKEIKFYAIDTFKKHFKKGFS